MTSLIEQHIARDRMSLIERDLDTDREREYREVLAGYHQKSEPKKVAELVKQVMDGMDVDEAMEGFLEYIGQGDFANLSKKRAPRWQPPEGGDPLYKQSASSIADVIASSSDSLGQANSRLNFFINRFRKDFFTTKELANLKKAVEKLPKKFGVKKDKKKDDKKKEPEKKPAPAKKKPTFTGKVRPGRE